VVNNGSDVTYTPNANYNGSDNFSYTVSDGSVEGEPATVTITVTPVNDAPVGAPTIVGTPTQGQILTTNTAGISDADGLGTYSYQWQAGGVDIAGADNASYTLTQSEVGVQITVTVSYTDAGGTAESLTSAEVGPVSNINDAPVAADDFGTTAEDNAITLNLLANDSDVDGDILSVISLTQPANGTVINNGSDVTYTPNANYNGSDNFSYTVSDGNVEGEPATVTITITPVNDPPVAADDIGTTAEDNAITLNLLANDSDIDGDSLSVISLTQPANGTVVNNGSDVTYTPNANYNGSDNFSYTVSDGNVE
ncbi:MAG: tandem-95 repeat protein, partial [Gammaproteobacteria bacterium]|nr:tandem-95 repeat protein [Gammaproteobacteria bacterium]